ncbi:cellulose binding domain-containing protein [Micromonospora sp. KC723]|uniref:cellulose binding domain-containing protein n=1 Tax=Micromonospora sp. KC723 TaxID=2530381 RepID=UPI00104AB124|nr:cellulose binding domain-containing protein [Micromonospora sp. KC723]TDB77518.1 hypothetical protein E1165_03260 [Micromonospora sp. KC723]
MQAAVSRPRRTMAVVLLDAAGGVPAGLRRALTGRGGGSRVLGWSVLAVVGMVLATALVASVVLRAPDRLTPLVRLPAPPPGVVGVPDRGEPRVGSASPPAPAPADVLQPPAAPDGPPAAPEPDPASPSGPPVAGPPSATATATPLRAEFTIESRTLFGYRAAVTISNPGSNPTVGWTLVVTLPRESSEVSAVTGARVTRSGASWTFVPDETTERVVGAGSVQVTFRVSGSVTNAPPTGCAVDGTACAGLAD